VCRLGFGHGSIRRRRPRDRQPQMRSEYAEIMGFPDPLLAKYVKPVV
jgi:hypothetical protein